MKKFTLTLICALFAIGGYAQSFIAVPYEGEEAVKVPSGFKLKDIIADQQITHPTRRGSYVTSFDVPVGGYSWSCYSYNGSWSLTTSKVAIFDAEQGGAYKGYTLVNISGLFSPYVLQAKVYPDNHFELLPNQCVLYNANYGYDFVLTALDDDDNEVPITGAIFSDKENNEVLLAFDNILIRKQRNTADFYYPLYCFGEIETDKTINGLMEVSYYQNYYPYSNACFPVILSQEGNEVAISNFLGYGKKVYVELDSDGTAFADAQLVKTSGSSKYYLASMNWSELSFSWGVFGSWSPGEINFGSFSAIKYPGYNFSSVDAYTSAKIYYVNSSCQRYNYSDPEVAASAPTFAFDGGTTGIQNAKAGEVVSESYVDRAGRQVTAATKGIVLKTTTYADGTKKTVKVIRK